MSPISILLSAITLVFVLFLLNSFFAFWLKHLYIEKRHRKNFVQAAEAGASVRRGFSVNLKSGKVEAQQRPARKASL